MSLDDYFKMNNLPLEVEGDINSESDNGDVEGDINYENDDGEKTNDNPMEGNTPTTQLCFIIITSISSSPPHMTHMICI
jgi:hypothetical protein